MLSRPAASALVAVALVMARGEGAVLAQPPPAPPAPTVAPPAPPPPEAKPKGAVVVAVSPGAGPAARALAREVYLQEDLRPSIDDATARVLAGDAAPENAPPRLKELADLRASIVTAFTPPAAVDGGAPPAPPSDLVARRLLASLGTDLHAVVVVPVFVEGARPVARALRTATSAFERIEIGPAVDIAPDGARTYRWPGAAASLHDLVIVPPAPAPASAPLAPKADAGPAAPAEPRPFYKSPWFWGSLGGAAVVGLSVFLISRSTQSAGNVHLMGQVGP